jgi:hypothetical protein
MCPKLSARGSEVIVVDETSGEPFDVIKDDLVPVEAGAKPAPLVEHCCH